MRMLFEPPVPEQIGMEQVNPWNTFLEKGPRRLARPFLWAGNLAPYGTCYHMVANCRFTRLHFLARPFLWALDVI